MTEVVQAPDLQALIATIADVKGWVSRLGDPSRLAGDPASLRRLSISHRETAASLRTLTRLGFHDAQSVNQWGAWEGTAANSFSAHWTEFANRVEDLASRHDQMASALSGVAAEAERLNADLLSVHEALSRWLSLAAQSALTIDPGQVGRGPPTIAPGVGQAPGRAPRGRERDRSPGEKGIPVVGHPPAAHPPPHGAALGPAAAGPLDAPILQGAALAAAIMRRIQQRSKSGNVKGGGKSAGPKK